MLNNKGLSMSDLHEELKICFATYLKETELFEEKGVKVAGQRARKALHDMSKIIIARRKEIQEKKQTL